MPRRQFNSSDNSASVKTIVLSRSKKFQVDLHTNRGKSNQIAMSKIRMIN